MIHFWYHLFYKYWFCKDTLLIYSFTLGLKPSDMCGWCSDDRFCHLKALVKAEIVLWVGKKWFIGHKAAKRVVT
jgi:hypothetical protein